MRYSDAELREAEALLEARLGRVELREELLEELELRGLENARADRAEAEAILNARLAAREVRV